MNTKTFTASDVKDLERIIKKLDRTQKNYNQVEENALDFLDYEIDKAIDQLMAVENELMDKIEILIEDLSNVEITQAKFRQMRKIKPTDTTALSLKLAKSLIWESKNKF